VNTWLLETKLIVPAHNSSCSSGSSTSPHSELVDFVEAFGQYCLEMLRHDDDAGDGEDVALGTISKVASEVHTDTTDPVDINVTRLSDVEENVTAASSLIGGTTVVTGSKKRLGFASDDDTSVRLSEKSAPIFKPREASNDSEEDEAVSTKRNRRTASLLHGTGASYAHPRIGDEYQTALPEFLGKRPPAASKPSTSTSRENASTREETETGDNDEEAKVSAC
jgi:hypothetical protein